MDNAIMILHLKNNNLIELRDKLLQSIECDRSEILMLKKQLEDIEDGATFNVYNESSNLDEIMKLLSNENQILQIKKITLVRQIMEQQELCIELNTKLNALIA